MSALPTVAPGAGTAIPAPFFADGDGGAGVSDLWTGDAERDAGAKEEPAYLTNEDR